MVHRIFEASELTCSCTLEVGDSGLIRADVVRISREECTLDCKVNFRPDYRLEVVLQLGDRRHILPAMVADSGPKGLRLRWYFIGSELDEDSFETLLMSAAGLEVKAPRRETRSREGAPATKPVRIDGHIDVEATLRSRARMVDTRRLSNRHVRVLDMGSIMGLISEAVEDVLVERGGVVDEEERRRLIEETEAQFRERLQAFQNEKQDLEARSQQLEEQLQQARQMLTEERLKVISTDRFTVSDAGMVELETRMSRILERSLANGTSPEGEEELRSMLSRLLDDEREKISEQAKLAQGDRIELAEIDEPQTYACKITQYETLHKANGVVVFDCRNVHVDDIVMLFGQLKVANIQKFQPREVRKTANTNFML